MNRNFNFNSTTKWVHAISVEKYHGKTYPQPHQTHGRPAADIHISKTFTHWPEDSRGYLHHQSLEALRKAANNQGCGICSLILAQVELCQSELEELKPQWDAGTIREYGWPLWEMWIVKRGVGGDGFWVMSTTDDENKRNVRLVAAIGLCVEDGEIG